MLMFLNNEYKYSYLLDGLEEKKLKKIKKMIIIDDERIKYNKEFKKYKKTNLLNQNISFYEKLLIILNCNIE